MLLSFRLTDSFLCSHSSVASKSCHSTWCT
jgi:hypothetical protein